MERIIYQVALVVVMVLGISLKVVGLDPIVIEKEVIINAGIEEAWQVLGPQFEDAYVWASAIKHSETQDSESLNGSTCSERGCDVSGMGQIKERLTVYSDIDHVLAYDVLEGMPGMVRYAKNKWLLTDLGNGTTKLTMKMEALTGGFMGWMMKPMMKMKLNKMAKHLVEEFKFFVETGNPHERTIKETIKENKKRNRRGSPKGNGVIKQT